MKHATIKLQQPLWLVGIKIASCLSTTLHFLFVFNCPSVSEAAAIALNVCEHACARKLAHLLQTIQPDRDAKVLCPHSSSGSVCVCVYVSAREFQNSAYENNQF